MNKSGVALESFQGEAYEGGRVWEENEGGGGING
jgi:hypothetical protein